MTFNVDEIRQQFPILSREVNGYPLAYLDNAASAQKPDAVVDALARQMRSSYANVHRGLHTMANETTEAFEAARSKVAAFLNAPSSENIVFTRGATEALNLCAYGLAHMIEPGDEIVITQMEHHSNIVPWHFLREQKGVVIKWIPVDEDGALDMEAYRGLFTERTKFVSVVHMSNVLGTANPAEELTRIAHEHGAAILFDGTQAAVHMPVDVSEIGCDFYVFTGHKLYGPNGAGVLYAAGDWLDRLPPYQGGGEMIAEVSEDGVVYADVPHKFEAGTPAIADVIGLGAAIDWVNALDRTAALEHERSLLDRAEAGLSKIDGVRLFGRTQNKGAIASFLIDGAHPHDLAQLMDKYGVAVRAGHHCAHPLMKRYGVPGTVRASFAPYNTADEVDAFLEALHKAKSFLI